MLSPVAQSKRTRAGLKPAEQARLALMSLAVLAVNTMGWGIFVSAIAPRHFHYAAAWALSRHQR